MSGVEKVKLWLYLFIWQAGNFIFHEIPWLVLIAIVHQEQSQNAHSVANGLLGTIKAAQRLKPPLSLGTGVLGLAVGM